MGNPPQLPTGYKQRVETLTRRIIPIAERIYDVVREFNSEVYEAQGERVSVRIYKGQAPDCIKCNDHKWLCWVVEARPGIVVPQLKPCPACNKGGIQPPPVEGE